MYEVAALSVEAVAIDHEGEAGACLIGVIIRHVISQLTGAVCELALIPIWAETLICVVPAKRPLDLRAIPIT